MEHPFKDKLVVFIGRPLRCKRGEARDALIRAGGVPDENITAFTNFVVAFPGAEKTQAYKRAVKYSKLLCLLSEDQYFDILEGKAQPPELPERSPDVIVYPAKDTEAHKREQEQFSAEHITHKRVNSMARYGVQTPEGRVKVDMRELEKAVRLKKYIEETESE